MLWGSLTNSPAHGGWCGNDSIFGTLSWKTLDKSKPDILLKKKQGLLLLLEHDKTLQHHLLAMGFKVEILYIYQCLRPLLRQWGTVGQHPTFVQGSAATAPSLGPVRPEYPPRTSGMGLGEPQNHRSGWKG